MMNTPRAIAGESNIADSVYRDSGLFRLITQNGAVGKAFVNLAADKFAKTTQYRINTRDVSDNDAFLGSPTQKIKLLSA